MAVPYTNNNGSTFYNINDCRSFTQPVDTNLVALSSHPCSEVILINKGSVNIQIYDNNYTNVVNSLTLSAGETFTLRGITNSANVSAKTVTGTSQLYFRTQFFSLLPQR